MSRVLHEQESRPAPERIYTDFVTREQFINITGIFVTPQYFDYIYKREWSREKKSGITLDEFLDDYETDHCYQVIEVSGFRFICNDDILLTDNPDDSIYDIVDNLVMELDREGQQRKQLENKCKILENRNSNILAILSQFLNRITNYIDNLPKNGNCEKS